MAQKSHRITSTSPFITVTRLNHLVQATFKETKIRRHPPKEELIKGMRDHGSRREEQDQDQLLS